MTRRLRLGTLAAAAVLTVPVVAHAAPVTGPYTGTSQAKVIWRYQQFEPEVQKGAVRFNVTRTAVTGFRLRGQRAQCPGTPGAVVVNVAIPRMALNARGAATGQIVNPTFGPIEVRVKVAGNGTARGTVKFTTCRTTATFTAKAR